MIGSYRDGATTIAEAQARGLWLKCMEGMIWGVEACENCMNALL